MIKFLYTSHAARVFVTGPRECGKSCFLTILGLDIINECGKTYIYSPNIHEDFYQKLNKCFSNILPRNVIKISGMTKM